MSSVRTTLYPPRRAVWMSTNLDRYTHALQSLSHALILAPQSPFYFLQFAETAYLALDVTLSLKMFLVAVDMTDDDDGPVPPQDSIPTGSTLRAWYGVKLVRTLPLMCARGSVLSTVHTSPRLRATAAVFIGITDASTINREAVHA